MEEDSKEIEIYKILNELKKGNDKDKSFVFDCIGYLSNESVNDSLELKLEIIENKINEYLESKKKNL